MSEEKRPLILEEFAPLPTARELGLIFDVQDEIRRQIRRALFGEVGRPTENQSDVPSPFEPETNGNLQQTLGRGDPDD